jgi:S-adenosylmethionine:tRNA ribosyltransferase-isomerase
MRVSDFDYDLPEGLIAQHPVRVRDGSRLMVLDRGTGTIGHTIFSNILDYLKSGDVLVLNDTKVLLARLIGRKVNTGGRVEVLLLKEVAAGWEALLKPAQRLKVGQEIAFGNGELHGELVEKGQGGMGVIQFSHDGNFLEKLQRFGLTPLPPYIKRDKESLNMDPDLNAEDHQRYQTVYAKHQGSVAAPTAGLHFTEGLLDRIRRNGVVIASITLHVGLGTFKPIRAREVSEHRMDPEFYEVSRPTASAINQARGRVVAVGTSTVRALETATDAEGMARLGSGYTNLFIYPGYRFRVVDVLLTNFHLPRSTPLMLVSAFAGGQLIRMAYREAIEKNYRFYSYGDAMLII